MKRLLAVSLLLIYLFSIGGELVLRQVVAYRAHRYFVAQTGKGLYNVNDLTEVIIPVNMPQITDWHSYVKVSGQLRTADGAYNYVKMKMTHTAIYLLCVPNYSTTKLCNQNIIIAKNIKGNPVVPKSHVPNGKSLLISQLIIECQCFEFSTPVHGLLIKPAEPVFSLVQHNISMPEQPPRLVC